MGEMADYYLDQMFDPDYDEMSDTHYDDGVFFPRKKPRGKGPCPLCGCPTKPIVGVNGPFYGCSRFPKCKGSRNA